MRAEVFETLKGALRARNLTYADLAERIGCSEPTIKRIFANRDTKLSRLVEICDALDLRLDDIVAQAKRTDPSPVELSDQVELQLSEDPSAFHLFLLLREGLTAVEIAEQFDLTGDAVFNVGMRLERMGLVEVQKNDRLKLRNNGPIRFRRDGPLNRALAAINLKFVRRVFLAEDSDAAGFLTQSRHISDATARQVMQRIRDLTHEFKEMARQDQLTLPSASLQSRKLTVAFSAVDYAALLSIENGH